MKWTILIILLLFLAACQAAVDTETPEPMPDMDDHIGCQEDEIDVDGNCVPAEENNAGLFGQDLSASVTGEDIVEEGFRGYLASPTSPGQYPGVLMIHEWWGLNDNIREMADILANEGYTVLAIDLYGGEVADDSDKARELASSVRSNPEKAVSEMQAAVQYLRANGASQVASLGWCFGGQQSLQASLNEDIDATVIYYGQLTDDREELKKLNGPVLGIFGSEDTGIPVESVSSFEAALDEIGVQNSITVYDGVGHAFANPSGSNYAPEETVDAWSKTVAFLSETLDAKTSESEPDKTFVLTGENFGFFMDGQEAPELVVQEGDLVRIEFTSTSGFHDWVVDEFGAATDRVRDGEGMTAVEFVADTTGTFEYYCSVGSHRANGMIGTLLVE